MRQIKKDSEPPVSLSSRHENPPTDSAQAKKRWGKLRSAQKAPIYKVLSEEQLGLCSYSEIRPDRYGIGVHIEHIQPKSKYPERTFDYANLILSALESDDLSRLSKPNQFGGHHKLDDYDDQLFVSCLDDESSDYFVYLSDGRVEASMDLSPEEKTRAEYTISLLNLNSPYLVNHRRNWLDELDQLIEENLDDPASLVALSSSDLIPVEGKLSEFYSATRQRFLGLVDPFILEIT